MNFTNAKNVYARIQPKVLFKTLLSMKDGSQVFGSTLLISVMFGFSVPFINL